MISYVLHVSIYFLERTLKYNNALSNYLPNSRRVLQLAQPNFLSVLMLSSAHLPPASANPK